MKPFEKLPKELKRIVIDDGTKSVPYIEESFYNVCKWWLETYPSHIFALNTIVKITNAIKEALEIRE